ncbi:MAG: YHYH protein [Myxococcota bacterium]
MRRTSGRSRAVLFAVAGLNLLPACSITEPGVATDTDPSQASSTSAATTTGTGASSAADDTTGGSTSSTGPGVDGSGSTGSSGGASSSGEAGDGLHPAFAEFSDEAFTIMRDGDEVVLESTGLPNHPSPYWSNTTPRSAIDPMGNTIDTPAAGEDHPLFVPPTATSYESMAPGNIDDFMGSYTLRVSAAPTVAPSPSATGLGPIGMAVSGSMIYNDEEGPNVPLDNAVPSLDFTAAHTGPQSYHYHLEPHAWSEDDDSLIGIMSDGFFLYGRRNPDGEYPADLDASGGHVGPTPHADSEYHYHIQNDAYLGEYFVLFPGDYQGTPSAIQ